MAKVRRRGSQGSHTLFPCRPGGFDPARGGYALPTRRAHGGLPRVRSASAPPIGHCGALYPACMFPCQRFTSLVAEARA